jgi:hypothetical protein
MSGLPRWVFLDISEAPSQAGEAQADSLEVDSSISLLSANVSKTCGAG